MHLNAFNIVNPHEIGSVYIFISADLSVLFVIIILFV